jgi:hypothetical protein
MAGSMSSSWKATTPPGRTRAAIRCRASPGSPQYMRTSRPTAASKSPTSPAVRVVLDEGHVVQPERLRAFTRDREGGTVEIDADDFTLGPDELGRQEHNVPCTASHVEDAHAGLEAGRAEEPLGRAFEEGRLAAQALIFIPRARQGVCGVGRESRGRAASSEGRSMAEGWHRTAHPICRVARVCVSVRTRSRLNSCAKLPSHAGSLDHPPPLLVTTVPAPDVPGGGQRAIFGPVVPSPPPHFELYVPARLPALR